MAISFSSEVFNTSDLDIEHISAPLTSLRTVCISLVVGLIICITITGNIMVIVAFILDRRIRAVLGNWFILNLSVCDLTIGFAVLPFNTHWVNVGRWSFGETFCKAWLILDFSVAHMSVLSIMFISLDRYWMVTKTSKYRSFLSKNKILAMIIPAWITTVIYYTFVALAWAPLTEESPFDFNEDCELEALMNVYFIIVQILLAFVFPLTVITYLNLIVYTEIKRRTRAFQRKQVRVMEVSCACEEQNIGDAMYLEKLYKVRLNTKGRTAVTSSNPFLDDRNIRQTSEIHSDTKVYQAIAEDNSATFHGNPASYCEMTAINTSTFSHQQMPLGTETKCSDNGPTLRKGRKSDNGVQIVTRKEFKKHRKAAITLAVLVSVFVICWLPYHITAAWNTICQGCVGDPAWEIVNYLLWCNSTVNPFLYAITNSRFRRNFVRFLGWRRILRRGS
ncbi:muscarinic acetylcholine receptor M3-like [Acanthaster planci]|uniref:Muscarinic acetylcholine receptor M3-like n=1 Tax=Acanthaster planci TaxID=133434 RepID=A0A8B7Y9G3_ACAPL|nr:muscarinic acetylcholine receptor M3-like [Acanthaster planci]